MEQSCAYLRQYLVEHTTPGKLGRMLASVICAPLCEGSLFTKISPTGLHGLSMVWFCVSCVRELNDQLLQLLARATAAAASSVVGTAVPVQLQSPD